MTLLPTNLSTPRSVGVGILVPDRSPRPVEDAVLTFMLFTTPPGWSRSEDTLSGFEPGRRYGVSALTKNGSRSRLLFDLDDLDLPDGMVLADRIEMSTLSGRRNSRVRRRARANRRFEVLPLPRDPQHRTQPELG